MVKLIVGHWNVPPFFALILFLGPAIVVLNALMALRTAASEASCWTKAVETPRHHHAYIWAVNTKVANLGR